MHTMKFRRATQFSALAAMLVMLASCSLEARNLGGPPAVGAKPPQHGLLGVEFEQLDSLTIIDVAPGSPAEQAQVAAGDTITALDGQKVRNRNELQNLMKKTKPGTSVELQLTRDDETRTVQVKLMNFNEWADLRVRKQERKDAQISE